MSYLYYLRSPALFFLCRLPPFGTEVFPSSDDLSHSHKPSGSAGLLSQQPGSASVTSPARTQHCLESLLSWGPAGHPTPREMCRGNGKPKTEPTALVWQHLSGPPSSLGPAVPTCPLRLVALGLDTEFHQSLMWKLSFSVVPAEPTDASAMALSGEGEHEGAAV